MPNSLSLEAEKINVDAGIPLPRIRSTGLPTAALASMGSGRANVNTAADASVDDDDVEGRSVGGEDVGTSLSHA
ncbi:hypothetical protein TSMEX_008062 [Taenia solium]|eukprot:TsM_000936500 transcript=TsM_000936500 gene=TsM_000936500